MTQEVSAFTSDASLTDLPTAITLACQWEVVAAKPGNVHRSADFHDLGLMDFLHSGVAVSNTARRWVPVWCDLDRDAPPTFGRFIYDAIQATRHFTRSNTNLGICLLLGPLAEAWARTSADKQSNPAPTRPTPAQWRARTEALLAKASVEQTRFLYQAIQLAKPGGLGSVPEADVTVGAELRPSDTVAHVMKLAAERDSIAAEFVSNYSLTFEQTVPSLSSLLAGGYGLQWAIVGTYLRLLAGTPDTLIARKVGWERSREISTWARQLVDEFFPLALPDRFDEDAIEACEASLADFDFALRSDGNRLNPGTTADLIVAGLFVAALNEQIPWPVRW
jgi:triphosphoribosyl-dephospho-CoA synthase